MVKRFGFFAGMLILLVAGQSASSQSLTLADVQTVIAQAVSTAVSMNQRVTVSVTDKEGHLLGTFVMTGAPANTLIRSVGRAGQGLENLSVPSTAASYSKAATGGLLSAGGNAFTTRTASFIIQEHFPPGIDNTSGGPLYGVQFSTLLCSDVAVAGLPLGLSGDPGGMPLYKNGVAVGGVGVEGDGLYTVDRDPMDNDQPVEETIAVAASRGFEAPVLIRADNILVGGIRLPYANVTSTPIVPTIPFASLPGAVTSPVIATPTSDFIPATLNGVSGQFSTRFPIVGGTNLTAAEVTAILGAAAGYANITRAGIRQPIGSNARVTMSVVDTNGKVLGIFRQLDAPVFGLDVSVQKARTANFFALSSAGAELTTAGFGGYRTRANADGLPLNGGIAFSARGFGFLHRPLFPDGINNSQAGPFSTQLADWSPFNDGLQLDLIKAALTTPCAPPAPVKGSLRDVRGDARAARRRIAARAAAACPCTAIPELPNGIQIFAGGIPLYRGTTLVGAIGVSGDGIEQDDLISAGGANAFAPPAGVRSDQIFVRGVRLPFLKFPARPFID